LAKESNRKLTRPALVQESTVIMPEKGVSPLTKRLKLYGSSRGEADGEKRERRRKFWGKARGDWRRWGNDARKALFLIIIRSSYAFGKERGKRQSQAGGISQVITTVNKLPLHESSKNARVVQEERARVEIKGDSGKAFNMIEEVVMLP